MKKVRFKRLRETVIVLMSLSFVGCSFNAKDLTEHELNDVSGVLGYSEISRMAYMGGSVFYNPKAPSEGQLYEGTKVAVRLGKVAEVSADTEENIVDYTTFCDLPDMQEFGYITVNAISSEKISFTYNGVNENGVIAVKNLTLSKGEAADLNDDNFADVKYVEPEEKRVGFEKAVYLTFLSSKEDLSTSMFSVIPEQYSRGAYPSGIMGINPDGKFIATKYEGESSDRAALKGVSNGDFVLDAKEGKYHRVNSTSNFKSARAIEDLEIDESEEISLEDVFPLLYVNISQDVDESAFEDVSRAAAYSQYDSERKAIEKEFSKYKSWNVLPNTWKVEHVGEVYAKLGINGSFSISFKNVECNLSAAACVKFEVNPGYEKTERGYYFKEPIRIINWNKTIQIGVVPFSIGVDGKVNIGYERKTVVDYDFCAGFIGMYGASVKVGANYGIKKWFKPYFNPYADYTLINKSSYFFGIKSGGTWTPTKTIDNSVIPEIEITPKVGVANNTVWVGLGLYDAVKLRKYSVENLRTREYSKDTYIYNKFGMNAKYGINAFGKHYENVLYNFTPTSDFVQIAHWTN